MAAVAAGELAVGQGQDALQLPPVLQLAGKAPGFAREARLGIELGKGGLDGGDVPPVAVEEIDLLEPVGRERSAPVTDGGDEGRGPQGDGAREAQMMLGHADVEGGRHQDVAALLGLMGDDLWAQPVGAQQAGGAMLLVGADGNDHCLRALQEALDLGPGGQVKQHGAISGKQVAIIRHRPSGRTR